MESNGSACSCCLCVLLQGFEQHVKKEHNQWAYLFVFIHLDETRPNDYTALELYVHKMVGHCPSFVVLIALPGLCSV